MVVERGKLKFRTQRFTKLTDSRWEVIKEFLDTSIRRKYCLRNVVDAILRICRTGLQWRNLEGDYPPWESVYYYFRRWQRDGTWSDILSYLVELERLRQGRFKYASFSAVDSQSR